MPERDARTQPGARTTGYVAIVLLWVVLLLHFFADRIWDEEPAVLKWAVIGYGCLVLLGLLGSLVFGKRDEKVGALILLAVVALLVAFIPPRQDRQASAAADALVHELSEKGTTIAASADALPRVPDKPASDFSQQLRQAIEDLQEQAEWTADLSRRIAEVLPRAPTDKRDKLARAFEVFSQQIRQANEKRDQWIKQVREQLGKQKKAAKSR